MFPKNDTTRVVLRKHNYAGSGTLASLPPHLLYLKKYASVIFFRSLDPN